MQQDQHRTVLIQINRLLLAIDFDSYRRNTDTEFKLTELKLEEAVGKNNQANENFSMLQKQNRSEKSLKHQITWTGVWLLTLAWNKLLYHILVIPCINFKGNQWTINMSRSPDINMHVVIEQSTSKPQSVFKFSPKMMIPSPHVEVRAKDKENKRRGKAAFISSSSYKTEQELEEAARIKTTKKMQTFQWPNKENSSGKTEKTSNRFNCNIHCWLWHVGKVKNHIQHFYEAQP